MAMISICTEFMYVPCTAVLQAAASLDRALQGSEHAMMYSIGAHLSSGSARERVRTLKLLAKTHSKSFQRLLMHGEERLTMCAESSLSCR
jgi:ABC-type cobalamin transport system ATPase subunit